MTSTDPRPILLEFLLFSYNIRGLESSVGSNRSVVMSVVGITVASNLENHLEVSNNIKCIVSLFYNHFRYCFGLIIMNTDLLKRDRKGFIKNNTFLLLPDMITF